MKSVPPPFRSRRGSILIVAMLLAAIIGVSLVSYLKLSTNSLRQANRSFYSNAGMNLAEIGLEEAISCFNQLDNTTVALAWPSPWVLNSTAYHATTSPNTPSATRTFTLSAPGPGTSATVKVYVHHYDGTHAAPKIVAKSTITDTTGQSPPIHKYIEVTLRKRSLFANGLVARNNVSWVGQPMADSWDSDLPTLGDGVHRPYSSAYRTANVVVGSISGNIGLAGGEVWGYAKTGEFGSITGGSVHPLGTTTNDPTRRTNDFNSTFPMPTTPTPSAVNTRSTNISGAITLPASGDVAASDGKYYYNFTSGAGISIAGSDIISITASRHVVFIMNNHSGVNAIQSTGNSGIDVNASGSLNVYTNGNISIAGRGFANDNNNAATAMFWGTNSTSQTVSISGNGTLTGIVYAPNASVSLNGGGTSGMMQGAVVASSISMNGHTEFHYDDALGRLTTGNPYGISKWKELQSATERAAYDDAELNF
jgi:hypothetical protein